MNVVKLFLNTNFTKKKKKTAKTTLTFRTRMTIIMLKFYLITSEIKAIMEFIKCFILFKTVRDLCFIFADLQFSKCSVYVIYIYKHTYIFIHL